MTFTIEKLRSLKFFQHMKIHIVKWRQTIEKLLLSIFTRFMATYTTCTAVLKRKVAAESFCNHQLYKSSKTRRLRNKNPLSQMKRASHKTSVSYRAVLSVRSPWSLTGCSSTRLTLSTITERKPLMSLLPTHQTVWLSSVQLWPLILQKG